MLQAEPEKLFVFWDNMIRRGYGGQAKEMRGEPNAIGIPTKKLPSMKEGSFLTDADHADWVGEVFGTILDLNDFEGVIVWPEDGIGTGRANLQNTSPLIWGAIERLKIVLEGK